MTISSTVCSKTNNSSNNFVINKYGPSASEKMVSQGYEEQASCSTMGMHCAWPRPSPRHCGTSAETTTSCWAYAEQTNAVRWERPCFSPYLNHFYGFFFLKKHAMIQQGFQRTTSPQCGWQYKTQRSDLAASSNGR